MNATLMDVVVCRQPGELAAERRPVPTPADGEVLVRVKRVGIACMRAGNVPTRALHTHGAPLLDLPTTLPGWLNPDAGVIKALVEC